MSFLYLLILILNCLFVNDLESCSEEDFDEDSKLLSQLMQFINKNHNLSLHVLNISERLNKLELQTIKNEEKLNRLEQNLKTQESANTNAQKIDNTPKPEKLITPHKSDDKNCVDEKDSIWFAIQRRKDGSVDFFRDWKDYKNGFGDSGGEFFIGLEKLHSLTNGLVPYELLIEMETFTGEKRNASYDHFVVGSEDENYKLKNLGRFHGTAGDSLNYHLGQWFSTKDRRNDQNPKEDCAKTYEGGWWYNECHQSNLNGHYFHGPNTHRANGIHWYKVTDYNTSLKFVEMKIRPRSCKK
ncbi:ficolin-2-like [Cochliomyia hominivorax]